MQPDGYVDALYGLHVFSKTSISENGSDALNSSRKYLASGTISAM